ncbi:hypothetical protein EIK77_009205 [Talaromyces pinophilus]|nr:hypothetical protein EIK77_009205 [Talaromyces pinophilus]
MWSRIKGFRRTTDLQALLNEKSAAPAVSNFWIETRVLEQFTAVDPKATGTHDNAEEDQQHDQDTGLRTNMTAQADNARTRSAPSSIRTSQNNTNTSFESRNLEPANGDVLWDGDED